MIKAKKEFGQNFLKDSVILDKIVQAIPNDTSNIVEIGPGLGDLTLRLLKISKVKSYEIDRDLEKILTAKFADDLENGRFELVFGDALEIWQNGGLSEKKYFLAANLPYYVATNLILRAIDDDNCLGFVVMVQKEVGDRFAAKPSSKEYNSLTVYLNYYFNIKKLFVVSRNVFVPKPNVDSIVIELSKKEDRLLLKNDDLFFKLVRDSFKYKRKNLRNNLKEYDLSKVEEVLKKHGYDLTIRAEALSLELFVEISNNLS